jgi:hypothetical protein
MPFTQYLAMEKDNSGDLNVPADSDVTAFKKHRNCNVRWICRRSSIFRGFFALAVW